MNPLYDIDYVDVKIEGRFRFLNHNEGLICLSQTADISIKYNSAQELFYKDRKPTKRTLELFIYNLVEAFVDMYDHYKKGGKDPATVYSDILVHFDKGIADEQFAISPVKMTFKKEKVGTIWPKAEWNEETEYFDLALFSKLQFNKEIELAESSTTIGVKGYVPDDFLKVRDKLNWWTVDMVIYMTSRAMAAMMHAADREGTWEKNDMAACFRYYLQEGYSQYSNNENSFEVI